jgi:hypothetical protein
VCADILPDEAREGDTERKERVVEESFDACVDGHARHRRIAECVDVGLNDKRGDAHKDCLETGGNTRAKDGREVLWHKEGAGEAKLPCTVEVKDFAQGEQCRRILCGDGGKCRTRDTAGDDEEKENIECDVEHDGSGKVVQGTRRIAERTQDRARGIV